MSTLPLLVCIPLGILGLCSNYLPHLSRFVQQRRIKEQCIATRTLVLTYDDGPGRILTPLLLDLLAGEGVKSTFFLLGHQAQRYPQLIDRIVEEGHEVGCHTQRHLNAWRAWPWQAFRDIYEGYTTLSPWVHGNGIFRPPNGKVSLATWLSLLRRQAQVGWWTVDTKDSLDSQIPCPRESVDSIRREGGGVVLMHDYHQDSERIEFVLDTTQQLIDCAKTEGFKIRRLGDLMTSNDLISHE